MRIPLLFVCTFMKGKEMIFERIRKYRRYRATVAELNGLTDRELSDIGVARGEIKGLARQANGR